jgi:DNA gyrase subunit B
MFVDLVLQYNDSYNDQILCFTNAIPNPDGGTHATGFRTALTRQSINRPSDN